MESYMFTNGLPVLFYCDHEPLIRIRQLSKAMRKRVFYIVKDKILLVKKDPYYKAKRLSKWIRKRASSNDLFSPIHPFKKIIYYIDDRRIKFEAEILVEQSGDLPPKRQPFKNNFNTKDINNKTFPSLYFERIYELVCPKETIQIMPKHTFELVDRLILLDMNVSSMKEALLRIKRVTYLAIKDFSRDLIGISWLKTLKILFIGNSTITEELELPSLTKMYCGNSTGLCNLKCPKLEFLEIDQGRFNPKEIASLTSLKILHVYYWYFEGNEHFLPTGLKHIYISCSYGRNKININPTIKQCPELFSFKCNGSSRDLKCFQRGSLRKIEISSTTNLKEKSTVRLKYINVSEFNVSLFNQHPEIISKALYIYIDSFSFDWKHLPEGYRKLKFSSRNIFEEERIDKHIDKLKGSYIITITVEKASSARKILKAAAKVREIRCNKELEELRKEFAWSGCKFKKMCINGKKEKKCCIF